ncbi:hypothetical protein CU097_002713, partial [Rhizopus azygosporus]
MSIAKHPFKNDLPTGNFQFAKGSFQLEISSLLNTNTHRTATTIHIRHDQHYFSLSWYLARLAE